jgi:hypothetical protein
MEIEGGTTTGTENLTLNFTVATGDVGTLN